MDESGSNQEPLDGWVDKWTLGVDGWTPVLSSLKKRMGGWVDGGNGNCWDTIGSNTIKTRPNLALTRNRSMDGWTNRHLVKDE